MKYVQVRAFNLGCAAIHALGTPRLPAACRSPLSIMLLRLSHLAYMPQLPLTPLPGCWFPQDHAEFMKVRLNSMPPRPDCDLKSWVGTVDTASGNRSCVAIAGLSEAFYAMYPGEAPGRHHPCPRAPPLASHLSLSHACVGLCLPGHARGVRPLVRAAPLP